MIAFYFLPLFDHQHLSGAEDLVDFFGDEGHEGMEHFERFEKKLFKGGVARRFFFVGSVL